MRNLQVKILTVILLIIIIIIAIYFFTKEDQYEFNVENVLLTQNTESQQNIEELIIVHVCGEVSNPGIVSLPFGSRIINAIEACRRCHTKCRYIKSQFSIHITVMDKKYIYQVSLMKMMLHIYLQMQVKTLLAPHLKK